ncbi:MAG: hypothetical protein AAF938_07460 [Myxococcota bacterium]
MALPGQLSFSFGAEHTANEDVRALVPPSPVANLEPPPQAPTSPAATRAPAAPSPSVVVRAAPGTDVAMQASAAALTDRIAARFGCPVRVVITDNRRTMVSGRRGAQRLELRLHRMFLKATDATIDDLAQYLLKRDRNAGQRIDAFIEAHREAIGARKRATPIRTRGRHYDLTAIFDALATEYFPLRADSLAELSITWGRRSGRRRQRSIRLGTYTASDRLIRVHPVLDQSWVPDFYVESVVHHEMLHHLIPPRRSGRRMNYHTPEFRRCERLFARFADAEAWETKYLDALLKSASNC